MTKTAIPYCFSFKLFRDERCQCVLGLASPQLAWPWRKLTKGGIAIGWGRRSSGVYAEHAALRYGVPFTLLEDGFLRSYGLGATGTKSLSWVVDHVGIYYDATRPSLLENMLNEAGFSTSLLAQAEKALELIQRHQLSKYNLGYDVSVDLLHRSDCGAPSMQSAENTIRVRRVLVVDQTAGDASIRYGLASEATFVDMLHAAVHENPGAEVWVKTHPDVLAGKKNGCLDAFRAQLGSRSADSGRMPSGEHGMQTDTDRIHWVRGNWHPHALLEHFDQVYVVTSQMGLDALLLGKKVSCFGMPFYAGWGLTDDRQVCVRRTAQRSLLELVAASYLQYARYFNPETRAQGTFFDVAEFIARQKRMTDWWAQAAAGNRPVWSGRVFCFGFRYWKHAHVRPFFGECVKLMFAGSAAEARAKGIQPGDRMAVWGQKDTPEIKALAKELNLHLVRVEDGFLRSVGLGADFIPPMSLVFDRQGIYYDPSGESDLEQILNTTDFSAELLERARCVIQKICDARITKYNIERDEALILDTQGRKVILVPGQVEDDASILKGTGEISSNEGLLRAVREACPDAFIIYKPHPDVLARNRRGDVDWVHIQPWCDHVESHVSVIRCIEYCDAVHTMTSQTGFDALLRGKQVVTYGKPFYAGWGLTVDHEHIPRRVRRLTLEALAAGTLLTYPRYFDPEAGGFVECEVVIEQLIRQRALRKDAAGLNGLKRQMRKWGAFSRGVWDAWKL